MQEPVLKRKVDRELQAQLLLDIADYTDPGGRISWSKLKEIRTWGDYTAEALRTVGRHVRRVRQAEQAGKKIQKRKKNDGRDGDGSGDGDACGPVGEAGEITIDVELEEAEEISCSSLSPDPPAK